MPYTLTHEPTFLRIVLHGALTPQDMAGLAQELAAIKATNGMAPHRLLDLSAITAPYLTYPDLHAFAARRMAQTLPHPSSWPSWPPSHPSRVRSDVSDVELASPDDH